MIKNNSVFFIEKESVLFEKQKTMSLRTNTRVVLIDGCSLVMQGIEKLLNTLPFSLNIDNHSQNNNELKPVFTGRKIDVVISGLFGTQNDILNGLDLLNKVKELHPNVKIIVITQIKNTRILNFLANMGVDGLISCDESLDEMKDILTRVLQRKEKRIFSSTIKSQIPCLEYNTAINVSRLSCHEIRVVGAFLKGRSLHEISTFTSRSLKTVSHYKRSAMRKLGVQSDAMLLQYIEIIVGQRVG
ncbi:LuxR C-terminal-related transcriptional regulator [Serratia oryzae]|uniref:HTH luxR-type domain-containing protein n=1 Tax=Serratia oryzae TaxID=2034155 RepID=A0A1S8CK35_9GAMM|nr:LuxR C-terminal-related transcriptional regulator [Serratia oryzae]OMQ23680.1 hypothetical protein BMI79_09200 [Serratia oryzae]